MGLRVLTKLCRGSLGPRLRSTYFQSGIFEGEGCREQRSEGLDRWSCPPSIVTGIKQEVGESMGF